MIRNGIISFLCLFLFSCTSGKKEKELPENLIPKDTFKELMIDIHLLEASQKLNLLEGITDSVQIDQFYIQLFKEYQTDLDGFQASHDYYSADKETFLKFYEELVKELNQREKQIK